MVTSLIVQRTNSQVARVLVIAILAVITAVCGFFAVTGIAIPEWFVIVGRWIPALVAVVVARWAKLAQGPVQWFNLRPGGWRRLVGGGLVAVLALLVAYGLSVTPLVLTGAAELQPWSALGQVALLLIPMVLIYSLSTLGEEATWRGLLQDLLAEKGFWPSSILIAGIWVLFHVPLHATMALQGVLPWTVAATSTISLFGLGVFLSAVVTRFGSVWPAVFAHAMPLSALNLLADAGSLSAGVQWLLTAITTVVLLLAAWIFTRTRQSVTG